MYNKTQARANLILLLDLRGLKLGKTVLITVLYISVAWTLMISYQLFTETAVTTLVNQINNLVPSIGFWIASNVDMIIFVYAFSWTFVLSSVIPCLLLGKERGALVQFFVCLILTFLAFVLVDVLEANFGSSLAQLFSFALVFSNPVLAALYLSLPCIVMIGLDARARRNCTEKDTESLVENWLGS